MVRSKEKHDQVLTSFLLVKFQHRVSQKLLIIRIFTYLQFTGSLDLNYECIKYNMIFIPANSKYKKQQKGKAFNKIKSNVSLCRLKFGTIGLRSTSFGRLDSKQLNSFKKSITKIIKKRGKFILNIFPQTPITKKPLAIRMGKGKGFVDH